MTIGHVKNQRYRDALTRYLLFRMTVNKKTLIKEKITIKVNIITQKIIQNKILLIQDKNVMLDRDLAELYEVETSQLKRQARRNIDRFPSDFMFILNKDEFKNWRCQFGISNEIKKGLRYPPMAFTEHGILMLSSILNSQRAIQVNIQIMRAFNQLRELLLEHKDLRDKIKQLENKYDYQFKVVFTAIKELLEPPEQKPKNPIGFHVK